MKKMLMILSLILVLTLGACNKDSEPEAESILDAPQNVTLDDIKLTWDGVDDATAYIITIENQTFETEDTTFWIGFLEDGHYTIEVSATDGERTSEPGTAQPVDFTRPHYQTLTYRYNLNSSQDLMLYTGESFEIHQVLYADTTYSDYDTKDDINHITNTFMTTLNVGEHTVDVITNRGLLTLDIEIIDQIKPHMVSNISIDYDETDVFFSFEVLDGYFDGLSGHDITEDDYTIQDNWGIIHQSFIDDILAEEPDRSTLILSYVLRNEDEIIFGSLFISFD